MISTILVECLLGHVLGIRDSSLIGGSLGAVNYIDWLSHLVRVVLITEKFC